MTEAGRGSDPAGGVLVGPGVAGVAVSIARADILSWRRLRGIARGRYPIAISILVQAVSEEAGDSGGNRQTVEAMP